MLRLALTLAVVMLRRLASANAAVLCAMALLIAGWQQEAIADITAYTFVTGTDAFPLDMSGSSGATSQLIGPDVDDAASAVTSIGFDFAFRGQLYQQFSVNSNGLLRLGNVQVDAGNGLALGAAGQSLIAAYATDIRTHTTGKVHYRVDGVAPNRVLVVEWLNMQSKASAGGTADLTFQVRLQETSGIVDLVYSTMTMSAAGAGSIASNAPFIGLSSGNTAGSIASLIAPQSGTPAPSVNVATPGPQFNSYTVAGPITALTINGSGNGLARYFSFRPSTPAAPTGLSFTLTTTTTTTLNWTDSSNELLYAIYRSTDGVNFAFDGTAAQNATSYSASLLLPGTAYTWRVFAISEGAFSTALTGTNSTTSLAALKSAQSGLWSNPATWVGGFPPSTADDVVIDTGHTVTVNTSPTVASLTVAGTLQYEANTARTLVVRGNAQVNAGGALNAGVNAGRHRLTVNGSLTNNGSMTFTSADIIFGGLFNATFDVKNTIALNTGSTVFVNKVGGTGPTLSFLGGCSACVLVDGSSTTGFFSLLGGTLRLVGGSVSSAQILQTAAWTVPAGAGLWVDNPLLTVQARSGNATIVGSLTVSQGTLNVGVAANDSLVFAPGARVSITGGAVLVAGRFGVAAETDAVFYTQSGGNIAASFVGNASATAAGFDLGSSVRSAVSISGGTAGVFRPNSNTSGPRDYRNQCGVSSVTGGNVQFGALTGLPVAYGAAGRLGNIVIDNDGDPVSLAILPTNAHISNSALDVTIASAALLNLQDALTVKGATFTNNGTLSSTNQVGAGPIFAGSSAQSYTGSGSVPSINSLTLNNAAGLTIDPATSGIIVSLLTVQNGGITHSNKITLGLGDASNSAVTIGDPSTPTIVALDQPLNFNLGTGKQSATYRLTTTPWTIGPEMNPAGILSFLTVATGSQPLLAGGFSLTTDIVLLSARLVMSANQQLTLKNFVFPGNTGWVDGKMTYALSQGVPFTFPVGTANGYSPVTMNVTSAATFPATFSVTALQGVLPALNSALALQRNWSIQHSGSATADYTFQYVDPTDLPVGQPESNLVLYNQDGLLTTPGGTVNAAANTANITGSSSFGFWSLAVPSSMTITKTHVGSFAQGQNGAQFNLAVANSGAALADGTVIKVTDTLPASMTFVSGTGSGWTCGAAGQVVTCTATQAAGQPFAAGATSNITLTVNIAANAPGTVLNTASCNCDVASSTPITSTDSVSIGITGTPRTLTITKAGSGTGTVTDAGGSINCGALCSNTYSTGTQVTLTASPSPGSVFVGWLGPCTGTSTCVATLNANATATATFAAAAPGNRILDADNNNNYDALTDGLLIIRRLFGLSGTSLTNNGVAANAQRSTPTAIATYIDDVKPILDIDGNGTADALSDGVMILRYLFGLPQDVVISNAIGSGATRTTATAIKQYLDSLRP